jgi:hypothetical protein
MNMCERFASAEEMAAGAEAPSRSSWLGLLRARLAAGLHACAGRYEAAALHHQLSALSDAELQRRGLSRETLARDVAEASGTAVTAAVPRRVAGLCANHGLH